MPSDSQQLTIIKSQALALIAQITADPKPTYTIDRQSVSWAEYLRQLQETVAWCDRQQAALEPFEIRSRGLT